MKLTTLVLAAAVLAVALPALVHGGVIQLCTDVACGEDCNPTTFIQDECVANGDAGMKIHCPTGDETHGNVASFASSTCDGFPEMYDVFEVNQCFEVHAGGYARVTCDGTPPAPPSPPSPTASGSPVPTPSGFPIRSGSFEYCAGSDCETCHTYDEDSGICVKFTTTGSFRYICPATEEGDVWYYSYSDDSCTRVPTTRNVGKPGTCHNLAGSFSVRARCNGAASIAAAAAVVASVVMALLL